MYINVLLYVILLSLLPATFLMYLYSNFEEFNEKVDFKLPYSTIKKMLLEYSQDEDQLIWSASKIYFVPIHWKEKPLALLDYKIGVNSFLDYIRYYFFLFHFEKIVEKGKKEKNKVKEYENMKDFLDYIIQEEERKEEQNGYKL